MKKILISILLVIGISGCSSNQKPVETPSMSLDPEITASVEPSISPTSDSNELLNPTKKVNVGGFFDILVADTLPEQVDLEIESFDKLPPSGSITFSIKSKEQGCDDPENCSLIIVSYIYGTEENLFDLGEDPDKAIIKYENDEYGTIYVCRCYQCGLNCGIRKTEGQPDYYQDYINGDYEISPESLIKFVEN